MSKERELIHKALVLFEEKKYTKIDLNIQTQLKSKYSLILYEIIIDYTNQYNKFLNFLNDELKNLNLK